MTYTGDFGHKKEIHVQLVGVRRGGIYLGEDGLPVVCHS